MSQTNATSGYTAAFEEFEAALNGGASSSLHARRREAITRLGEIGLPTAQFEAWRHTNPAPITRTCFAPITVPGHLTATDIEPFLVSGVDGPVLVFADGWFVLALSRLTDLPAGVRIHSLSTVPADEQAMLAASLATDMPLAESAGFASLNTAFLRDGAVITIDADSCLDQPVQILHINTGQPGLTTPRVLFRAGANSKVGVIETFAATAACADTLTTSVAEINVGASAIVDYSRIHLHGADSFHTGAVHVTEEEGARFTAHTFCLSGRLLREDMHTALRGQNIESTLNGLSLPMGQDHVDNYTTIEHAAPNCSSHELYKGVLGGASRSVFRGKIHVHREAQKTDAYQSNQSLLMSDDAEINSKPQLEIYADDVKCSHGSTTGQLDADALFYLRTRGLGLQSARRVLTRAFADELVNRLPHDGLRAHVDGLVSARLDAILEIGETTSQ